MPLDKKDGKTITDDTRIRSSLPTLNYLTESGAKVVIGTHLGRPKGVDEKCRLAPVASHLKSLVKGTVLSTTDCIGEQVRTAAKNLQNGEILLLENLRFHKGEEKNDPAFAKA